MDHYRLLCRATNRMEKQMKISKYAVIQDGNCIWGTGETIDDCIRDANEWLDSDQQILVFEAHDQLGREHGGLTDWTSSRRFQMAGDLFITDDPTVIAEYTPPLDVW